MNIETILRELPVIKEKLSQLEEMIDDYQNCKSSVTKKLLTQAIEKYSTNISFKENIQ